MKMKKFRVTVRPDVDNVTLLVEAENKEDAVEKAEEIYSDGELEDYWTEAPYIDPSSDDTCTVVNVEEV